jgi:tetratricopeptide (TPR) repeat protein/tRNA A-37 threonylcarbamoyl transferase component Bud32
MVCSQCGTDTPLPAAACQKCRTPFAPASVSAQDSETVTYGHARTPARGATAALALEPGSPFGTRYRILRELGAGGMGIVYQAWDDELGVAVALKIIRPDATDDPLAAQEIEKRFKRELLLARQVTHKNVVRIHDLGEVDGTKYITMPCIEGQDLADVLRDRGRVPVDDAVRLAKQIAAGLVAAHDAGVVHRDLKPENIMIDGDGQPLIMDFGISRSVVSSTATATAAGAIIGTLEYMAPEQARGQNVDQRADIYALGLIVHDLIAGRQRVAASESALTEMMRRMQQAPAPLRTLVPEVPEAVERIVSTCLKANPDERSQKTAGLLVDLESLGPDGRALPLYRQKHWNPVSATLAVLLLVSAGAAVWFWQHRAAPAAPAAREPLSILIADFRNGANDPVFDGALEQALGIAMEGASFVTSFPRQQARRIAGTMQKDAALDENMARLVAVREGIKVVLSGAIATEGSGYEVSVTAIDPGPGAQLAERHATARNKADVLPSISTLAVDLRRQLGDTSTTSARQEAAETFTAGSLEAMAAYARGQELNAAGKPQEALAAFKQALEHDPQFGRAYMNIASIYTNLKQPQLAQENYERALRSLDRMNEREKYRTLGTYYLGVTRDYDKAIENYEALVKAYPADNTGYANLALAYVYVRNLPKAAEMGRRAIEIYPKSVLQRTNYATYSMYSGDFDTAIAQAQQALGDNPAYEWAALTLALSRASENDEAGAREVYGRLRGMSPLGASLAAMGLADLEMYSGRADRARAALDEGIAADEKSGDDSNRALKLVALAELQLAAGKTADAVAAAERATTLSTHEAVLVPAARIFIRAGPVERARALQTSLEHTIPPPPRSYAHLIAGEIALARDRVPEAIDEFRAAQKLHDSWLVHVALGEAYAAAKRFPEALGEWNACVKRRGEATDVFFADTSSLRYLPRVYYELGVAQDAVGSQAGARASFETYLKLRGGADPPDAQTADARRRLQSGS